MRGLAFVSGSFFQASPRLRGAAIIISNLLRTSIVRPSILAHVHSRPPSAAHTTLASPRVHRMMKNCQYYHRLVVS